MLQSFIRIIRFIFVRLYLVRVLALPAAAAPGADKLAAAGLDKFAVLRENGFDFLIKETVDPRTLNSTMKEQANTEEGIPDEVMEILSTFDVIGINRRKATSRVKKEGR